MLSDNFRHRVEGKVGQRRADGGVQRWADRPRRFQTGLRLFTEALVIGDQGGVHYLENLRRLLTAQPAAEVVTVELQNGIVDWWFAALVRLAGILNLIENVNGTLVCVGEVFIGLRPVQPMAVPGRDVSRAEVITASLGIGKPFRGGYGPSIREAQIAC